MLTLKHLIPSFLLALALTKLHAAPITWVVGDIDGSNGSGDLSVSNLGTLIEAANFGGGDLIINSVFFSGLDFENSGSLNNLNGLIYDQNQSEGGASGIGAIDVLLDTISFQRSNGNLPTNLTGLTTGNVYQVQFFLSFTINRTYSFDDLEGNLAALKARNPAQSVTGTFVADASTQAITMTSSQGSHILNGYQLRDVTAAFPRVTTIADEDNGSLDPTLGTGTSLREAVNHAPANATISFDPSLFTNINDKQILVLGRGELLVDKELTIDASNLRVPQEIQPRGNSRHFQITESGALILKNVTLRGGASEEGGGAVLCRGSFTAESVNFSRNRSGQRGGAIHGAGGSYRFSRCSFIDNVAPEGSAIFLGNSSDSFIENCTVSNNISSNETASDFTGSLSFIGGNHRINHCTVSGNRGAGISLGDETAATITNSIIAGNIPTTNTGEIQQSGVIALVTTGPNLIDIPNPRLTALAWFGGETMSLHPLAGSLAIDGATGSTLAIDQRGFPRAVGSAPDLGAIEHGPVAFVTTRLDSGTGSLRSLTTTRQTPGTVVRFDPGVFSGENANSPENQIRVGFLDTVKNQMFIDASGVNGITLDAGGENRLLRNLRGPSSFAFCAMQFTGGSEITLDNARTGSRMSLLNCAIFGNQDETIKNDFGADLSLHNVSIFNNRSDGGGKTLINTRGGSHARIVHCSITQNTTPASEAGLADVSNALYTLGNNIIAGNIADTRPDIGNNARYATIAPNLIGNRGNSNRFSTGFPNAEGNFVGSNSAPIDALLLEPGINGGPVMTLLPRNDSPALDRGIRIGNLRDARGILRLARLSPDLGAVESQNIDPLSDLDGDGFSRALELALGTDPDVADFDNPNRPSISENADGKIAFTFGRGSDFLPGTVLVLERSTTLQQGSFEEVYRFDFDTGTSTGIAEELIDGKVTITDEVQTEGRAFYRLRVSF